MSRLLAYSRVGIIQAPIVRLEHIPNNLVLRQRLAKAVPLCREKARNAAPKQPIHFRMASGADAEQDHCGDPFGIRFGISQRQGTAPRSAEHEPSVDVQSLPQVFDIFDEILSPNLRRDSESDWV